MTLFLPILWHTKFQSYVGDIPIVGRWLYSMISEKELEIAHFVTKIYEDSSNWRELIDYYLASAESTYFAIATGTALGLYFGGKALYNRRKTINQMNKKEVIK